MREKTIYQKIAEKYNTTPEEVRREMQIAIDAGFDNPDPAVQEVFMGNLNQAALTFPPLWTDGYSG